MKFSDNDVDKVADSSELVFTSVPHGQSRKIIPSLIERKVKVIDLGADFRLKDPKAYETYYHLKHENPELLEGAAYGLPELHRSEIRKSQLVAVPGCMATATILGLGPVLKAGLVDEQHIAVDAKIGSSGAGANPTIASHHPERSSGVRPYKTVGHRHIAEIEQELALLTGRPLTVAFTPHAVNMVRGILATIHAFTSRTFDEKEVWRAYRESYSQEPFIRLVRDRKGLYRLPDPKMTVGTNNCDVGFELDEHAGRLVVLSAIDNLMKGAAGQAVQCFNIMTDTDEHTGLLVHGLHPL